MQEIVYWIWLSTVVTPGSGVGDRLFEHFEGPREIFEADESDFDEVEISRQNLDFLMKRDLTEAKEIYAYCMKNKIGLLTQDSARYPKRLRNIRNRPILLYYRGRLPDIDDNVCIAMVGTRQNTEYGERMSYTLSYDLTCAGAIIVSGMAKGIDTRCHRACLDAHGHTIAVLGCGIDRAYPRENAYLMEEIASHGTVITEYKPFTEPFGYNFPIRNRIISGLAQGTVIIEADFKSGAMITARTALLQGRDIFALPGEVGESNSRGTNSLIADGAKMVLKAQDILEEYEFLYPHRIFPEHIPRYAPTYARIVPKVASPIIKKPEFYSPAKDRRYAALAPADPVETAGIPTPPSLDGAERAVYDLLSRDRAMLPDNLVSDDYDISAVMTALTMLEIKGHVMAQPGGLFIKI